MDTHGRGTSSRRSSSPFNILSVSAHLFGITAIILSLAWLLHYREGFKLNSDNPSLVFNVHPFLMVFGFISVAGEATMAYKTIRAERSVQKFLHMLLNLTAILMGIVGIYAVFKSHNMLNMSHLSSLHSWIGMATFFLFGLQWVFGFTLFMYPKDQPSTRARALPWHVHGGRALLYMGISAALTGLVEMVRLVEVQDKDESPLIIFTGLAILLFGVTVDLSIALARYI